jgi:hypothetical protein
VPAALLCLPGLLLMVWYGWRAFSGLDRYRRAAAPERRLDLTLFRIGLHDALRKDLRRLTLAEPAGRGRFSKLGLKVEGPALALLAEAAGQSEDRPWAAATLEDGGRRFPVSLRLRGQQPWHWLGLQRSLKVRLEGDAPGGRAFFGGTVLNLLNDPNPVPVADELVLELARGLGLMTPGTGFARLRLNGADLGVFRAEGQVDESVLRRAGRFPANLFSGDLPPGAPAGALWREPARWKKVAWAEGEKKELSELERLLALVREADAAGFVDFARHELDLERFAALEALEIVFGAEERDARRNHKLYLDPHRGRWEPLVRGLRGPRHRPELNLAEHPLGLRLKQVPGYLSLRARALRELLDGPASPGEVRARAFGLLEKLLPELVRDPHWDATRLLPPVDPFLRRMLRPMDETRLGLALEAELATFAERAAFLRATLERLAFQHELGAPEAVAGGFSTGLGLWLEGETGLRLTGLRATFEPACPAPVWQVFVRGEPLQPLSARAEIELASDLRLEPVARIRRARDGAPRAVTAPVRYDLRLASSCPPVRVEAWGERLDNRARVRSGPSTPGLLARGRYRHLGPAQVPGLASGEAGPHPWEVAEAEVDPGPIRLGPGRVEVSTSRVFPPGQRVEVAPGTTLALGTGVSLVFLGPLEVHGTRLEPVRVEATGPEAFGGLALQGPGTAGSRLRHLHIQGGDRPIWRAVTYTAALNVHDTRDVWLEDCRVTAPAREGLHAGSVRGLRVDGLTVEDSPGDAVDLEFVEGELRDLRLLRAGDDGLDLMGGRLLLADSLLVGARGNALVAGEGCELRLVGSLLAGARVGLKVKNGARVSLQDSLVWGVELGLSVEAPTVHYPRRARLAADGLGLVGVGREARVAAAAARGVDLARVQRSLTDAGALGHLRREVLGLGDWQELEARVKAWLGGGAP